MVKLKTYYSVELSSCSWPVEASDVPEHWLSSDSHGNHGNAAMAEG